MYFNLMQRFTLVSQLVMQFYLRFGLSGRYSNRIEHLVLYI